MRISLLQRHPEFFETAASWIVNQWGSTSESAQAAVADSEGCPPTLVAIEDDTLAGILGYKIHVLQPDMTDELWINALYVATDFRRRGLGSQLVREAVKAAACLNRSSLYVYTDIPTFYESLGWQRFSYNEETKMDILRCGLQKSAC